MLNTPLPLIVVVPAPDINPPVQFIAEIVTTADPAKVPLENVKESIEAVVDELEPIVKLPPEIVSEVKLIDVPANVALPDGIEVDTVYVCEPEVVMLFAKTKEPLPLTVKLEVPPLDIAPLKVNV